MTATTRPLTSATPLRRPASLLACELIALFAGLLLCSVGLAANSRISPAPPPCPGYALSVCAGTASGESEGEEAEESEEDASSEAKDEEAGSESTGSPSNTTSDPSSSAGATNSGSGGSATVLSQLRLTAEAKAALKHQHRPSTSAVRFSFVLSAPAKVRVTLVKQSSGEGGTRKKHWTPLHDTLTLSVGRGRIQSSLTGYSRLSPGRYRLTVKPAVGDSRSIYLSARA